MFNDIFLYSNFALNIGCLIVGLIIDRFVRKFLEVKPKILARNSKSLKDLDYLLVDVFRQ